MEGLLCARPLPGLAESLRGPRRRGKESLEAETVSQLDNPFVDAFSTHLQISPLFLFFVVFVKQ